MRRPRLIGPVVFESRRGLVGVFAAVFAAVASVVNAADSPLALKLALAAIALALATVALGLFLRERAAKRTLEEYLANAIELMVLPGSIVVCNRGPRIVWDLDITAEPALDDQCNQLPQIKKRWKHLGVQHREAPEWMWFAASIRVLDASPDRDRSEDNPILVDFDVPGERTLIDLRVYWTDHVGGRRVAEGRADIAQPFEIVTLAPPATWM